MSKTRCAVCKGTGKCASCQGSMTRSCPVCWPKGQCPRCKGSGVDPA